MIDSQDVAIVDHNTDQEVEQYIQNQTQFYGCDSFKPLMPIGGSRPWQARALPG